MFGATSGSWTDFRGNESLMQKRVCRSFMNFSKRVGRAYNNLWSGAVLGHSAFKALGPWSLERGRGGPVGNWPRLALEARWRFPWEMLFL